MRSSLSRISPLRMVCLAAMCIALLLSACAQSAPQFSSDLMQMNTNKSTVTESINASKSESKQDAHASTETASDAAGIEKNTDGAENAAVTRPEATVSLGMIGDVLFHDWLIKGGLQSDGTYDYNYIYKYMLDDIAKIDYSLFDMEGTLAGEPYVGYPLFSAPDAVAGALKNAGFKMAVTANNHLLDRSVEGIGLTLDALRKTGLQTVGTRKNESEALYRSETINGIKVGFSAYTYETVRQGEHIGINGIPLPLEANKLINSFSLEDPYMAEDLEKLAARARQMRKDGNELIVFIMHWGTEYRMDEDWFQSSYAQALADAGVDLIFSCGPHVIEPIKTVSSTDGKHKLLVFYSLGNSVSDQAYDTGDSMGNAEDGLYGIAKFKRDSTGKVTLIECGYLATYVYKSMLAPDASHNLVMPIRAALNNPAAYGVEDGLPLLEASLARIQDVMSRNAVEGLDVQSYVHLE